MIIYSIIPNDIIFANKNDNNSELPELLEAEYNGEKVEVYSNDRNEYVINRIISTSPKTFLNSKMQPGMVIKSNIKIKE